MIQIQKSILTTIKHKIKRIIKTDFPEEPAETWKEKISEKHPYLPKDFLDPKLLPLDLLMNPKEWKPDKTGLRLDLFKKNILNSEELKNLANRNY